MATSALTSEHSGLNIPDRSQTQPHLLGIHERCSFSCQCAVALRFPEGARAVYTRIAPLNNCYALRCRKRTMQDARRCFRIGCCSVLHRFSSSFTGDPSVCCEYAVHMLSQKTTRVQELGFVKCSTDLCPSPHSPHSSLFAEFIYIYLRYLFH